MMKLCRIMTNAIPFLWALSLYTEDSSKLIFWAWSDWHRGAGPSHQDTGGKKNNNKIHVSAWVTQNSKFASFSDTYGGLFRGGGKILTYMSIECFCGICYLFLQNMSKEAYNKMSQYIIQYIMKH